MYFYGDPHGQPFWQFQPLAVTTYSDSGNGYDPEKAATDFSYVLKDPADFGGGRHDAFLGREDAEQAHWPGWRGKAPAAPV